MLTLGEVLDMPVLRPGRPELVHGSHQLDRFVRWVHTSEIAGIGSLLKGGEILLTTGLGLAGAGAEDQRRYVRELVDRDVTALFLELGRTFTTVPQPLLAAVQELDLPFVVLHGVVPFVEVTEAVHAVLVSRRLDDLTRADAIAQALNEILLSGGGLVPLLVRIEDLAGAPARVVGPRGRVVATSDATTFGTEVPMRPRSRAPITVFGRTWGQLEIDTPPGSTSVLLLDRAAVAVGMELLRTGELTNPQLLARHALLTDLATGRVASSDELRRRAEIVDLRPPSGHLLVGAALRLRHGPAARSVQPAAETTASRAFVYASVAVVEEEVLAVLALRPGATDLRSRMRRWVDSLDAELAPAGGRVVAATAGPEVGTIEAVGRSLATAREACELALELTLGSAPMLAADIGVHRLLRDADDAALEAFVDEQLGPLLAHDAATGKDLLRTLEVFLEEAGSKSAAAARLGIRRQTLYRRLDRIEALLGDLSHPTHRLSWHLALVAQRIRGTGSTSRSRQPA